MLVNKCFILNIQVSYDRHYLKSHFENHTKDFNTISPYAVRAVD